MDIDKAIEGLRAFTPDLTPPQMLELGVFGGSYFNSGDFSEFPPEWQDRAQGPSWEYDFTLNLFQLKAGQSLQVWLDKGWIRPTDPKGWFQWYCRYYLGRRCDDDEWQIGRWRNFARHKGMLKHVTKGVPSPKGAGHRQALLQWGYDPFSDVDEPLLGVMGKIDKHLLSVINQPVYLKSTTKEKT